MAEMRNGFDPETQYAALGERVEGQGRRLTNLENTVTSGFRQVEVSIAGLGNEFRSNTKTPWAVIWSAVGVSFGVLAAVGALAYRPVLSNQDRLESALVRLADTSVSQKELEWRTARGMEDRARMEKAVADLRSDLVPRAEHERLWDDFTRQLSDKQRQIDEAKATLGGTYSLRDYIARLTERLDRLEERRVYSPTP